MCTVFICVHVWGALICVQYSSVYMSGRLLYVYSIHLCTCLGALICVQYSSVYMSGRLLCTYSINLCTCLGALT